MTLAQAQQQDEAKTPAQTPAARAEPVTPATVVRKSVSTRARGPAHPIDALRASAATAEGATTPGTTRKKKAAAAAAAKATSDSTALLAFSAKQAEEFQAAEAAAAAATGNTGTSTDEDAGSAGKIRVYARVRPVDNKDKQLPFALDLATGADEEPAVTIKDHRPGVAPKTHNFNRVFDETATNEEVYAVACQPLLDAVMNGFNGTLLAYGQTGSGKTYTMGSMATFSPSLGYQSAARGMIPMVIDSTFERIERDTKHKYKVAFSYVQIYQDEVFDLLSPDQTANEALPIREHPDRGVYLEGISEFVVRAPGEVIALLAKGRRRLVVAETKMNRQSSRSHALCFISIECLLETGKGKGKGKSDPLAKQDLLVKGKITLCDLAGSERIKRSESTGERLTEAQHINSSLHELGNCVSALANEDQHHVPFRNSSLTRLLQESLGGNCKTSLIVCASPLMKDQSETKGTLQFGQRAMCVVQNARINVELDYRHLANELAKQLEYKAEMWTKLETKLKRKMTDSEKEAGQSLQAQREAHAAALEEHASKVEAAAKRGFSSTAADLDQQHRAELEATKAEFHARIAKLEASERRLKENAKAQATKAAKDMAERRKGRKQSEKQLLEELDASRNENALLSELVNELETSVQMLQEESKATLAAEKLAAASAGEAAVAAAIEAERLAANTTLAAASATQQSELDRYTAQAQATLAELTEELHGSMAAHEADVSELSEAHDLEVTNTQLQHVEEVETLSTKILGLEAEIRDLVAQLNRPKAAANTQTDRAELVEAEQQTQTAEMVESAAGQTDALMQATTECQVTAADFPQLEESFSDMPPLNDIATAPTTVGEAEAEVMEVKAGLKVEGGDAIKAAWGSVSVTNHDPDTGFPQAEEPARRKKRGFLMCC